MTASYFSLSCDSYKQNIFSGLTRLQENQDFVDLTLAADGHLVKVHKNIMALASPYIKDILKSSSNDNLVIYLNNVSHNALIYLLEYIYQGEVNVPPESLEPFLQLAQSLRVTGMAKPDTPWIDRVNQDSTSTPMNPPQRMPTNSLMTAQNSTCDDTKSSTNVAASIAINANRHFEIQLPTPNVGNHQPTSSDHLPIASVESIQNNIPVIENTHKYVENLMSSMDVDTSAPSHHDITGQIQSNLPTIQLLSNTEIGAAESDLFELDKISLDKESADALKIISQYSVTERGAVEIIVNRYIYRSHHNSHGGRKHRWRCSDYRSLRCPAFIDSIDGRIVQRKRAHVHPYHDDKIYKKHEKGLIFYSYKQAEDSCKLPTLASEQSSNGDNERGQGENKNNIGYKVISVTETNDDY